jgi:hypothetical protein
LPLAEPNVLQWIHWFQDKPSCPSENSVAFLRISAIAAITTLILLIHTYPISLLFLRKTSSNIIKSTHWALGTPHKDQKCVLVPFWKDHVSTIRVKRSLQCRLWYCSCGSPHLH